MTSQIGMMNRDSVALASDSAVTWGERNSYNTSEKIYQLAGRQPVGFMSCGLGVYMGVSWGRILGMYRERIGTRGKDKKGNPIVRELNFLTSDNPDERGYVEDFIEFLNNEPCLQSEEEENESMFAEIGGYIEISNPQFKALKDHVRILEEFDYNVVVNVPSNVSVSAEVIHGRQEKLWKQFSKLFVDGLIGFSDYLYGNLTEDEIIECDRVISEESELVNSLSEHYRPMLCNTRISSKMRKALGKIVGCYIAQKFWLHGLPGSGMSGMVIAGFGKQEETPTMVELNIRSKWKGTMRFSIEKPFKPDCANPFAQTDQIETILKGISPRVHSRIFSNLGNELPKILEFLAQNTPGVGDVTQKNLLKTLKDVQRDNLKGPPLSSQMLRHLLKLTKKEEKEHKFRGPANIGEIDIHRLGPPDLAELAEKFVDLESTIQYVHYGLGASVGGEIDVASITKEDGMVWVKRKNTIDEDLNPRIFRQPRDRASHI